MKTFHIFFTVLCLATAVSCSQQQNSAEDGGNAVIENIMSRRSIRSYKDCTVGRDTLQTILECGINAPNGMNKQSWEVSLDPLEHRAVVLVCNRGLFGDEKNHGCRKRYKIDVRLGLLFPVF